MCSRWPPRRRLMPIEMSVLIQRARHVRKRFMLQFWVTPETVSVLCIYPENMQHDHPDLLKRSQLSA